MERREEGREGKGRVGRLSTICLDFESPEKETTNRTAVAILDDIGVFGPCVCGKHRKKRHKKRRRKKGVSPNGRPR